jgi:hypothetical protein
MTVAHEYHVFVTFLIAGVCCYRFLMLFYLQILSVLPIFVLSGQQRHCTTNKLSAMGASLTAVWKRHLTANLDWTV